MSQPPSPYGPSYRPPGAPPPSGTGNKGKFWLGVVLALPAIPVGLFLVGGAAALAGSAGLPGEATFVVGLLVALLLTAGLVALLVGARTRWIGVGLIAGAAIVAIVAAGACIVLLAALSNSYST